MFLKKNSINILILIILLNSFNSLVFPYSSVQGQESSQYQQEIVLPFDIKSINFDLSYQPIDIHIQFDQPCWATSEHDHSIQVFWKHEQGEIEIESQIYQLDRIDEQFISACQLVFILPKDVTKNDEFIITYHDQPIQRKQYPDHLNLKKSQYYYEPISGQILDIDFYSINQDGIIPYVVSYKGSIFGNGVSQVVARLKPNATALDTSVIDQFASFSMMVSTDFDEEFDYIGSGYCTNPKTTILIDGNLMVKIKIESVSPKGYVKTTNVYTYYYNPSEPKRMFVNCTHEILQTFDMEKDYTFDGVYAYLLSFHSKSEAIEMINMGSILPKLYLYGKDDRVHSYDIPENPHSVDPEMILATTDDIDLGSEAWLCIHQPRTEKTHGLLFSKIDSLTNLDEEGIAIKAFVEETINLPGLEADTGSVFAARNHFDSGGEQQYTLTKGFTAQFDVSFITFQKGNWNDVSNESLIYQKSITQQKNAYQDDESDCDQDETYTITGRVTGVKSVPFGSALSAFTGKNLSYIAAELYQNDKLVSSTVVSRIPFRSVSSDIDLSTVKAIFNFIRSFIDWRNSSVFQQFRFTDISPGDYVVRIYKENPLFSSSRIYVGCTPITITEDERIFIHCKQPITVHVFTVDQNQNPLSDVFVYITSNGHIIQTAMTDESGTTPVSFPLYSKNDYQIALYYKDIPILSEGISPNIINQLFNLKKNFQIDLFDISISIRDDWNLPPSVQLEPELVYTDSSSKEYRLKAKRIDNEHYEFIQIPKQTYVLHVSYKIFEKNQVLTIDEDSEIYIHFPLTYKTKVDLYNQLGLTIDQATLIISRDHIEKKIEFRNDSSTFYLPPGSYQIQVKSEGSSIAEKKVTILSDTHQKIVTIQESIITKIGYVISMVLIGSSLLLALIRHRYFQCFLLCYAGLILLAALSPWWIYTGENSTVNVETRLHLLPTKMITFTETTDTLHGGFSTLPTEAILGLKILLLLLILSYCLLFFLQFMQTKYKKLPTIMYLSSIGLQILFVSGFLFIISQLTLLGVGSISGSGVIEYSSLDSSTLVNLDSSWGFGIGFFIFIAAFILSILYQLITMKKSIFTLRKETEKN